MLLPVDDAEYHLQVLSDVRSPAALQLLGYASKDYGHAAVDFDNKIVRLGNDHRARSR
jgi:hypothetical protein